MCITGGEKKFLEGHFLSFLQLFVLIYDIYQPVYITGVFSSMYLVLEVLFLFFLEGILEGSLFSFTVVSGQSLKFSASSLYST